MKEKYRFQSTDSLSHIYVGIISSIVNLSIILYLDIFPASIVMICWFLSGIYAALMDRFIFEKKPLTVLRYLGNIGCGLISALIYTTPFLVFLLAPYLERLYNKIIQILIKKI